MFWGSKGYFAQPVTLTPKRQTLGHESKQTSGLQAADKTLEEELEKLRKTSEEAAGREIFGVKRVGKQTRCVRLL